ncbi:MAG: NYN domain-containing protein [Rhodothermaceae bacterium]|nr:NYN domain-containing protein [Rhodothermaceae bacterium]MYC04086.1 NYN domain-containing protein [Rhodothermaceae bacterium]MYI16028.1 NYN domain-containing protein [Rhodothermaceae bacterium]
MTKPADNRLTRIGVFYDGMYFKHVSDYYNYTHERKARISISGLHKFLREEVGKKESANPRHCQIVDAHYFRGRLSATKAQERDLLLGERKFEDVLMGEGVTTHFLPVQPSRGEKGIDVWFSLEAFELAVYKRYDVSVLVTGDADYVPLVRKLNTLGTRVMLLAWDFEYTDENGSERTTRTSQALIEEVTYPVMMADIINDRSKKNDVTINNLFLKKVEYGKPKVTIDEQQSKQRGKVVSAKGGYGFIKPDDGTSDIFSHHSVVVDGDFNDVQLSDRVEFLISKDTPQGGGKAPSAVEVRKI